jgi:hypothetical protein
MYKILHIRTVSDFFFEAIYILGTTKVDVGFASWLRTDVRPPGLGCSHLAHIPILAIANHWWGDTKQAMQMVRRFAKKDTSVRD